MEGASHAANMLDSPPDFERERVLARAVGKRAGAELLGASVYEHRGRIVRLFWRDDGLPIPPNEGTEASANE